MSNAPRFFRLAIAFCSLFFASLLAAQTCTGNLLLNPGFENGLANWEGGGAIAAAANSGTKALQICQNGTAVRQTLPAQVGKTYTLKGSLKRDGSASPFVFMKFLSSSWQPLANPYANWPHTTTWTAFETLTWTAPVGTAWVEISVLHNQGTGCVFADDLCLTSSGGGTGGGQPDLTISNLNLNGYQVAAGKVVSYRFDLANPSMTAVPGNFSIKAWLSTDEILSADDVQDGIVPTGNFAAGLSVSQILGATTVPANLAPGQYFILLKVDADNQIAESNEANNTVYSSSPIQVNAPTGGQASPCEKFVGNGQLVCAKPATGSTNAEFVIDGGGQRSRATFSAAPALVSTQNLGAVSTQYFLEYSFEVGATSTSLVKKNLDGSTAYTKILPTATRNALPSFQSATEFGTGFVLMGGKNAAANQSYIIDSIFALKTDANLNIVLKKYIGPGNGLPYGAGASSLTVVSATRLAYLFGTANGGTSYSAWLRLMDENFVQKSEKQLYQNIWSAGAQLSKNLCRGFTVTDSQGLGYCKSGGCYRQESFDGEFVNDQFVAYNSSIFHHQTSLGNGIENYDFFTQTTDGGSIKGERYLTGNIFQNTNDTIVLKKFNAANTLLWTKKVRVPEASFVKKIVESGGEVYFLKQNYSSDWSVLTLSCLDAPTSLPDIFTSNFFINGALNFNVGQIINPVATLRNGGAATSKADVLFRYFLSTDNLFSPDDFSTGIGYQKPNTLDYPPGYSETVSAAGIPVLASFPTGNLFLLLVSDLSNTELESNEGNNTSAVPIIINGSNPGTCATNLLQNSGFENSLANWEGTGGTISTTASAGSKSLKLCQNGSIRQTIATTAGKNLTLLFKARSETGTGKVLSYIKYLSSSWQPLVTEYFDFSTTATFASATVSKTAPTGAVWVEIGFLKQTAGCVLVDEVCLSEGGGSNPCSPDVTAPVISGCPANINFQTINDPQPNISWPPPTATDACGAVNLTSNRMPGNPFPVGATVVTYTATDLAGNISTCSFTVTVTQVASNCVISGTVSNMQCSNNATPTNPADDTFTFDVTINKTGTCGSGWTSGTSTNGSYGVPFSVAPHLIAGGGFTFEVHDNVNFASIASVPIVPPPTCSGGGGACAANLLQNGGFENNLDNWEGTNPQIFNTLPSAGAKCIRLCQNASLRQTLATSPGKNLTLLFKARTETTGANKVLSYIKYLSSSWQPLVTEFFDFSTTATYSQGTVSKTAPTGAVWVEIGFLKQDAGCVLVDEVCLSEGATANPKPDVFGKSCFDFIGVLNGNNLGVGNLAPGGTVSFQSCSQSVINLFAPNTALTFKNKIYLSTDNTFSANDWLVSEETITTQLTSPCGQNCFYSQATYPQGNIPAGIAAGAYFMISRSDADGQIAESDETNNQYVQSVTVVQSGGLLPDLTISNVVQTGPVTLVGNQGVQHVPYSFDLKNNGTAAASGAFGIVGHISTDNILSANDPSFGFLITVNSLAAGATQALSGILQVQGIGPVGQFLILNADFQNVIPESNETNNTAATAAPLVQTPGAPIMPDLTAELLLLNGPNFFTGDHANIKATARNTGLVAVTGGPDAFGFYLSSNAVFDASDFKISAAIGTAASLPGGFVEVWDFFNYWLGMAQPGGIPTGQQFVLLVADPLNQIVEANETNNVASVSLNITPKTGISCTGNLLINGGFEAGVNAWTVAGGTPFVNGGVNLTFNGSNLRQFTAGSAGTTYTAKCQLNTTINATGNASLILRFLNASKVKIDSAVFNAAVTTTVSTPEISKTAPAGTAFVEVVVRRNSASLQSAIFVEYACLLGSGGGGGTGADLKITLTANKTNVPQWGNVTYTITAKNEGNAAISQANVLVWVCPGAQGFGFFTQANGLVFAGTPPQPTKGTFNSVSNLWEIGSLAAGQTAVLTLPAFTLTMAEKKVVAWSALQSPTDPDSQPNGWIPANCTPVQDDEAVWIINAGQAATAGDDRANPQSVIRNPQFLFPNPAGESVFLNLAEFLETEDLQVLIFDNKGLIVNDLRWAKVEFPLEEISLDRLQNGLYFVRFIAPNRRAETVKLAVQRTF